MSIPFVFQEKGLAASAGSLCFFVCCGDVAFWLGCQLSSFDDPCRGEEWQAKGWKEGRKWEAWGTSIAADFTTTTTTTITSTSTLTTTTTTTMTFMRTAWVQTAASERSRTSARTAPRLDCWPDGRVACMRHAPQLFCLFFVGTQLCSHACCEQLL